MHVLCRCKCIVVGPIRTCGWQSLIALRLEKMWAIHGGALKWKSTDLSFVISYSMPGALCLLSDWSQSNITVGMDIMYTCEYLRDFRIHYTSDIILFIWKNHFKKMQLQLSTPQHSTNLSAASSISKLRMHKQWIKRYCNSTTFVSFLSKRLGYTWWTNCIVKIRLYKVTGAKQSRELATKASDVMLLAIFQ